MWRAKAGLKQNCSCWIFYSLASTSPVYLLGWFSSCLAYSVTAYRRSHKSPFYLLNLFLRLNYDFTFTIKFFFSFYTLSIQYTHCYCYYCCYFIKFFCFVKHYYLSNGKDYTINSSTCKLNNSTHNTRIQMVIWKIHRHWIYIHQMCRMMRIGKLGVYSARHILQE